MLFRMKVDINNSCKKNRKSGLPSAIPNLLLLFLCVVGAVNFIVVPTGGTKHFECSSWLLKIISSYSINIWEATFSGKLTANNNKNKEGTSSVANGLKCEFKDIK